ncbi:Nif3-like dinuclear metal center hexameric protein [Marinomonas agarivorans]|nr:Nif3-like dinuclear metal center hexameric protein [Marinomonas agarivorans]
MKRQALEKELNFILKPNKFKDYAPNGLQVQGKEEITKIVTGVTACQALIDKAIELQADAVIVHHGYFWKNEQSPITGIKYKRISSLIKHDINLFAYHLPLDAHTELGNNAQLAKMLGLTELNALQPWLDLSESIGVVGRLSEIKSIKAVKKHIEKMLNRNVLLEQTHNRPIEKIALCSGGAQGYIDQAVDMEADLYITGEVSEQTIHLARERQINFIAAGHHASERYGVMALGNYLKDKYKLNVEFVDIDNPA